MDFNGKSILITGGTGSFGKKFIKTVLAQNPDVNRIVVYSRDEFKQFMMSNMPEFKPYLSKLRFFYRRCARQRTSALGDGRYRLRRSCCRFEAGSRVRIQPV